ncbi:LamG-like jellyroll fold domain-containing protein [Flavobacterium sp.]|uniref:T9SS type A sorting domain-containing protein n=1 Tax=Flavobacterium sp. TaxID=239 RepID=UPI00260C871C|nr:LamG-like jellyroll fold domain-containing protein [Flavobacterium sp.]
MKKILLLFTLILVNQSFAQAPTSGLVAYYNFENTLISNEPTHSFTNGTATNVSFTGGKVGQGVSFAGASALTNSSMVTSANLNTNCTIAWWEFRGGVNPLLYSMSFNLRNGLKYGYVGTSNCDGGTIYYDRYRLEYSTTTNSFCQTLNTHIGGQSGAWHHHAITKEGTIVKYYLDGVLAWTPSTGMNQDNSPMNSNQGNFVFGSDAYSNGSVDPARCITGTLDELYIYQRALSAAEIVTVKNSIALASPSVATPVLKFEFNNSLSNVGNTVSLIDPLTGTSPTGVVYVNDRNGNANNALSMLNKCYMQSAFTLPQGKNQRTVSFWLNRTNLNGNFWTWGNPSNNRAYGFNASITSILSNDAFGPGNSLTTTDTGTSGVWEHYILTYDGLNVAMYKNGSLIGSGTKPNWDTLGNIIIFGSSPDYNNGSNWTGNFKIDDFEVYNTFFNSIEVLSLYNSQNTLSSQNFQSKNLKASIYPNPTSDNFSIEMENEVKSVEIYSLQGQKIMTSTTKDINVSNLSNGIYLVRIEDVNNAISTQKLIIK